VCQIKTKVSRPNPSNGINFAHSKSIAIKRDILFAYLSLAAICLLWGTTFLGIRIGVKDFPPFLFAAIRQMSAGLLLTVFVFITQKEKIPDLSYILKMAVFGFFMITMGNGLVSWAEVFVDSGVAAIICSIMPVLVILINLGMDRSEFPNPLIVIGVIIGLGGIVLVFSEHLASFANPNYTMGIALVFTATISWAVGSTAMRRVNQTSNPFLNAGMQMFFGGVWCMPLSFLFDDLSHVQWTQPTFYSLIYLIIFGSAVAYPLYYYAIAKLPMTIASLYSYVNPLVAVVLGWLVLDEKLNLRIGLAFIITVTGIYLVNRGYQNKKRGAYDLSKAKA